MDISQLSAKEQELINKVLNFSLKIGYTFICFNDIEDKVDLDLSKNEYLVENTPVDKLKKRIKEIEKEIDELKIEQETLRKTKDDWINKLCAIYKVDDPYDLKDEQIPVELSTISSRLAYLSDYIPGLEETIKKLQFTIKNGGDYRVPLLGFFVPSKKKIFLCLDNINASEGIWKNERIEFRKCLIYTFVHELFHAWNYYKSGCKDRTVKEIDEPMVEFGTLYFLKKLASKDSDFKDILKCAEKSVKEKQNAIGSTAAYGFGFYLYNPQDCFEGDKALQMLEVYGNRSGYIPVNSADVHKAKEYLNPFYPNKNESENEILNLFYKIILRKSRVYGQVWTKSGKTNIVKDNTLVFEENVDDISLLDLDGPELILVRQDKLFSIYYFSRKTKEYYRLFEESFIDVKTMQYGRNIILVKRHPDGKAFLITPFEIRRLIDQIVHSLFPGTASANLNGLCQAEDFHVKVIDEHVCLFAKDNNMLYYIFPISRIGCQIRQEEINNDPLFFVNRQQLFVALSINGKTKIFTHDGMSVGRFDGFYDLENDFVLVELNGKFNFFIMPDRRLNFERWFEDCGCVEKVKDAWLFPVYENGECQILDECGNDISALHMDVLLRWKKEHEEINQLKENN